MDHRMRVAWALICLLISISSTYVFMPGADGPVTAQAALEGGTTTLYCDCSTDLNDELMLLVWYKNNAPLYSYDARDNIEWITSTYANRLKMDMQKTPSALRVSHLTGVDEAFYHCRVDFFLAPTRNVGVNLTVIVLPSQPFFMDELGNKVEGKIGPYHEGDTLVLSCLVIGGRPAPKVAWYSGEDLIDASDGQSDVPGVKENELYLPLSRSNAESLSCRATNTHLAPPVILTLKIDLYLAAYNVSINWVHDSVEGVLESGKSVIVKCVARGAYPSPELTWWLDHKHLTQHSNQSWNNASRTAESYLQFTPAVSDNGATLACVATNTAMPPGRDSTADLTVLNVTYAPIVEISKEGDGKLDEVVEMDSLKLDCEVKANPSVVQYKWFFNDIEIGVNSLWGGETSSQALFVQETARELSGRYACSARNSIRETRSESINITVLYPPECLDQGIKLVKETLHCLVLSTPKPDTYFWYIQPADEKIQHLTTGSPILPLSQITGSLATTVAASCEASNGIASQDKPCQRTFHFENLRPTQPRQCDITYEYEGFQMRCTPVENATYYDVSLWRLSTSNSSLLLERRGYVGWGKSGASEVRRSDGVSRLDEAGGLSGVNGVDGGTWLVRGALGDLRAGDEAGAAACNRYGCSPALLLRPTEKLLESASVPWWRFVKEREFSISIGAVALVALFVVSSAFVICLVRRARSKPAPVIQLVHLDDVAKDYLDYDKDHMVQEPCSLRSCSSGYSDGSLESAPAIDRRTKPRQVWDVAPLRPPPDVTLTPHRESAV